MRPIEKRYKTLVKIRDLKHFKKLISNVLQRNTF